MRRGLVFLILLMILGTEGRADDRALRALTTADESNGWRAVGRLNFGSSGFCTGALIAPDLVLTAAHCLYDLTTGARVDVRDIEFAADWRDGRAVAFRGVRRFWTHPGFGLHDPDLQRRVAHDVALVELDQPIRNGRVRPMTAAGTTGFGAAVGVVSYAHDRAETPALQEVCHVLARRQGSFVLDCDVDYGSSGAPIFVVENGAVRIVSLVSAKAKLQDTPVALGAALEQPLADLMALRAEGDGVFHRPPPQVQVMNLTDSHATTGAKFLRP